MKRTLGWNVEAALYLFLVSIIFTSMTAAYSTPTGGRVPGDPSPAQDIVIDGGKHAMRGETLEPPGDIVVIPAGEMHWHGATDDTDFEHLYVVPLNSKTTY